MKIYKPEVNNQTSNRIRMDMKRLALSSVNIRTLCLNGYESKNVVVSACGQSLFRPIGARKRGTGMPILLTVPTQL